MESICETQIKEMQTIDPVRAAGAFYCKECAYWNRSGEIMPDGEKADYGWCGKLLDADSETEVVTSEMDYCSFGEKEEE